MDITSAFLTVAQLALVPVIMAVVQIVKMTKLTGSDNRFAPLLSLVLGVAGAFLIPSATWQLTIIAGITLGCISAGVYSGVKATLQG